MVFPENGTDVVYFHHENRIVYDQNVRIHTTPHTQSTVCSVPRKRSGGE